jgi:hypothetical protein
MRRMVVILAVVAVVAVGVTVALVTRGQGTRGHAPHQRSGVAPLPPLPTPTGEQFGANAGSVFGQPVLTPAQIAADLSALRASGGTLVRQDAYWEASEPQPPVAGTHHYNWAFDDAIASALAAQGLRWLPIIDYAPAWAAASAPGAGGHPPPRDASAYVAYAVAFVARYGTGGTFWRSHGGLRPAPVETVELWNEPDNPTFWSPQPNLLAYAYLYAQTQQAIAAVAPSMHVIVGGLNHPDSSLRLLVPALRALHTHVDGIAIHPYARRPTGVLRNVRTVRTELRALGLADVPLYVTEFGWTVSPPGALDYAPAALRPGYIAQTLSGLSHTNCGIAAVTVFAWVSAERNPLSYVDWFGLSSSTADRQAFAAGVRAASGGGPVHALC